MDAALHLEALAAAYERAVGGVAHAAQAAHAQIDGDVAALEEFGRIATAPVAAVPADEPATYVIPPPAPIYNAVFTDSPFADVPGATSSIAFDDAPLWQS